MPIAGKMESCLLRDHIECAAVDDRAAPGPAVLQVGVMAIVLLAESEDVFVEGTFLHCFSIKCASLPFGNCTLRVPDIFLADVSD